MYKVTIYMETNYLEVLLPCHPSSLHSYFISTNVLAYIRAKWSLHIKSVTQFLFAWAQATKFMLSYMDEIERSLCLNCEAPGISGGKVCHQYSLASVKVLRT
jgi:hypothetical protein